MPFRADSLRGYLLGSIRRTLPLSELTAFVHLSRNILQAYFDAFRPWTGVLCEKHGISRTDLAYDCISEVFARDPSGAFIHIEEFAKHLDEDLATIPDHELLATFRTLLIRFADVQLARLYALADPGGAKIHRNIREHVKRNGKDFELERDFRGLVLRPAGHDPLEELPPFPDEDLRARLVASVGSTRLIPDLLAILRTILIDQSRFSRTVPLILVVQMFKDVYYGMASGDGELVETIPLEGLTQFDIDQIRLQVEGTIREKILVTYLARGKLDRHEAEVMFLAYQDLLMDWCSGAGSNGSIYRYLNQHLPMDEETYAQSYRVKMEYLLKIAREEFAARLLREL